MTAYPVRRLGDICEVTIGRQRSPQNAVGPHMVPYMRAANVKDGRLLLQSVLEMNFTPQEQHVYGLAPGDVLVTEGCGSPAELGASAAWSSNLLPGIVCFQNTLLRLRSIQGVSDPQYLLQLARWCHHTGRWLEASSGVSILHIGHGRARRVVVPCPPLAVQRLVGSVLSAYDDLIENNTRRIGLLEEMAQAIYREWFVEFRFPGHEGVRMVDSELGPIPEGWKAGPLADVLNISRNLINPSAAANEWFALYSFAAFDTGRTPTREQGGMIQSSKFLITEPSVLYAKLNPRIPRVWLVEPDPASRALASSEFLIVRPKAPWSLALVYSLLRSTEFASRAVSMTGGTSTSHQRVKPSDVLSMTIAQPTPPLCRTFDESVAPMLTLVDLLERSNRNLRITRDLLLPRLISGEIDVSSLDIGNAEPAA